MKTNKKKNKESIGYPWISITGLIILVIGIIGACYCFFMPAFLMPGTTPPGADITKSDPVVLRFEIFHTLGSCQFWTDRKLARKTTEQIQSELKKLEDVINVFDPDSEISKLNRTAYNKPFKCSDRLWDIIKASETAYEQSNGLFDVTIEPLMSLWGFHEKRDSLPSEEEISETLKTVGFNNVVLSESEQSVMFSEPGMSIDFSGIAKGYALDVACRVTRENGIENGIITLGGNLCVLQETLPGQTERNGYLIGITNPFRPESQFATVEVRDVALATSGDYENRRVIDGQTVSHIMNPKTGHYVKGVASVTVITPSCVDSDVFSTAVFVGGADLAQDYCERVKEAAIIMITKKNEKVNVRTFGELEQYEFNVNTDLSEE